MFVTLFGPTSHEARDAPDAAELAEEVILTMVERKVSASTSATSPPWWRSIWSRASRPIIALPWRSSLRRSPKPPRPGRRSCATPTDAANDRRH
jgi:hypothetical protein